MIKEDIYLICPVRDIPPEEDKILDDYVAKVEAGGEKVHYPKREVNQNDPIGIRICREHRESIINVDAVHIYHNSESVGSMFDLGMGFMAEKALFSINPERIKQLPNYIKKFVENYASNIKGRKDSKIIYHSILRRKDEINKADVIHYQYWGRTPEFLLDFGMSFATKKPIVLLNPKMVQRTPHKSFENVLLELDKEYRSKLITRRKT